MLSPYNVYLVLEGVLDPDSDSSVNETLHHGKVSPKLREVGKFID